MDQIHNIRYRFYEKGENISQIALSTNLSWKTVRKYVDMTDFNIPEPKPAKEYSLCPKLDPFKGTIDQWLIDDKVAPRKQRHTAKRVFKRLKKEFDSFDCSYRTVAKYYAVKHKEVFSVAEPGSIPLEHKPGEAQVDFGAADFYKNGRRHSGKYLEVSFPHSNKGYLQLFYGENMECLFEGLTAIFNHIGYVPRELWFDNTKTIVTQIIRGGGRVLTERFERFREHYRFKSIFTGPGKGHEKGNVESKVGYSRRNFLVPMPRFLTLEDYNVQLLKICEEDAHRDHYRHNATIEELFGDDIKACLSLPDIPFDTSQRSSVTTNKWGKFTINKGLHEYSASPRYASTRVNLKLTSRHVIVQDENFREIVRHRRMYGDTKQQSMEWLPYLEQISRFPRALKYSGIYEMLPDTVNRYLSTCTNSEVGKVLKVISELTDRTGFESAVNTVEQALYYGATDPDSLKNLYRRLYADVPELPPMELTSDMPKVLQMDTDLNAYDALLNKEVR